MFVTEIGSYFCSCNLILILPVCNTMAQQTVGKCDLTTGWRLPCESTLPVRHTKSAYKPSGPSGQYLSPVLACVAGGISRASDFVLVAKR